MTRLVEGHELGTVASLIAYERHVVVLTGAGVRAAAGLPTYRGADGIYENADIADLHHASRLPDSLPALWGSGGRGGMLRPDVVLFGERLDVEAEWETKRAVRDADVLLAVGTSGQVSTAAYYARYAADVGAVLVTVDPAPLVPEIYQLHVRMHAELALPLLLAATC